MYPSISKIILKYIHLNSTKSDVCMDIQLICLRYKRSLVDALQTSEKTEL